MAENNLNLSDAQARSALVQNPRYQVDLNLVGDIASPDQTTFHSESTITFDATHAGSTFLDITASNVHGELNGVPIPATAYDPETGRLRLDGIVAGHNTVHVVSDPEYSNTGAGMVRAIDEDGSVYLYTNSEPYDAHRFMASFDQPDLKAPYDVSITGPLSWTFAANEQAAPAVDNGDGTSTTRFATTEPLAAYTVVAAAGPYEHISDSYTSIDGRVIPLDLYARASLSKELHEQAPEIFEITKAGLKYYEGRFGAYPYGKYGQLFAPEFNVGAMENPGLVTINDALVIFRGPVTATRKEYRRKALLHEMDHHWNGDDVTMRWWNDLWLNESFASVMSLFAEASIAGTTQPFVDFAISARHGMPAALRQDELSSSHPIATPAADVLSAMDNFDSITYEKGAAVIRQLVARVGEDAFFKGVKSYLDHHRYGNATFDDLLSELSTASGRDLSRWAKDWVQTKGVNTLTAEVDVDKVTGRYRTAEIVQTGSPLRQHTIHVGIYDYDRNRRLQKVDTMTVDIDGERTDITDLLSKRHPRQPALLLVNDENLTYAKVRLDQRSLDTLIRHVGAIDDPLGRAVAWSTLWDMTRDAQISPDQWINIVSKQAPAEDNPSTIDALVTWSHVAAMSADPPAAAGLRASMANTATAMLRRNPGSDLQMSWLRGLVANADRPQDLAVLSGILSGHSGHSAPGLRIGQEAKWGIVTRLASKGLIDQAGIDAQLKSASNDVATRSALTARAAMPTPAAKQWAWDRINDPKISLNDLRAVLVGFQQAGQEGLTKQYTDQYPNLVAHWWKTRGEEATELTNGVLPVVDTETFARSEWVFPTVTVDHAPLRLTTAAARTVDPQSPAARHIAEGRDIAVRALHMRQASQLAGRERSLLAG